MATEHLIDVNAVSKTFEAADGPVLALDTTTLKVKNREFVAIVGPSGCGKTTLLKMIGGLIPVSSGEIRIRQNLVIGPSNDFGFVFQGSVLLPWKTAMENVLLPIRVVGGVKSKDIARAEELLELVGLSEFRSRYPFELSGGMQQRVAICRALIQDPSCLLLDEPFGALDALTRETMNVFFNELWRKTGKTVVLVTHSIQEAVFLSTRVIVMSARPGTVIDELHIPFEPERNPELIGTGEFAAMTSRIRKYFNASGLD
jgi:NitT/TauT family transport system ATP-binding protein